MRKSRIWLLIALLCIVISFPWRGYVSYARADDLPFYRDSSNIVYVTHGYCYHDIPDCPPTKHPYALDASEAIRLGFLCCSKCSPLVLDYSPAEPEFAEDDIIVYMMVNDEHYHSNTNCTHFDAPEWVRHKRRIFPHVQITLEEAEHLDLQPCKSCKPPKY